MQTYANASERVVQTSLNPHGQSAPETPLRPQPRLSVVVPLYNEAANLAPLLTRIRAALTGWSYELILVDDGSRDATVATVRQLLDDRTTLLVLARNYGQTSAMAAGMAAATGNFVATLDGDLQNDPADIPAMVERAEREGWDVVAGRRANRQDGLLLRKVPSRVANALIRRLTGVYLDDYGCTLKVFRRELVPHLGLYGQLHRFIPPLAHRQGARMTQVDVRHHPRLHGQSNYGLGRIGPVLTDLTTVLYLLRYAHRPMRLFGPVGAGLLLAGLGSGVWALAAGLGWLGAAAVALIVGGLNLLGMGMLAEMQMRQAHEPAPQPPYRLRSVETGPAVNHQSVHEPADPVGNGWGTSGSVSSASGFAAPETRTPGVGIRQHVADQ